MAGRVPVRHLVRGASAGLLLAVPLLAACSDGGDEEPASDRAVAGEVVAAGQTAPVAGLATEQTAVVGLPSGVVSLGFATDLGDALDEGVGEPVSADDGDVLLGITWDRDRLTGRSAQLREVLTGDPIRDTAPAPEVSLQVEGESYPLPGLAAPEQPRGQTVVAVPEAAAADAELTITYDGQGQTVEVATGRVEAGIAAPLAEPAALEHGSAECDPAEFSARDSLTSACGVERWFDTPYVADLGWSETGTWVVVDLTGQGWRRARVDGDSTPQQLPARAGHLTRLAFLVDPADQHTLELTFPAGSVQRIPLG